MELRGAVVGDLQLGILATDGGGLGDLGVQYRVLSLYGAADVSQDRTPWRSWWNSREAGREAICRNKSPWTCQRVASKPPTREQEVILLGGNLQEHI